LPVEYRLLKSPFCDDHTIGPDGERKRLVVALVIGDYRLRNLRSGVRDRYHRSGHRCPALVRHVSDDSAAGILSGYPGLRKFQSDCAEPKKEKKLRDSIHWYFLQGKSCKRSLTFGPEVLAS